MRDEQIKRRITEARERAGFKTRKSAADALGMKPSTYYGYEDVEASHMPSREAIQKLAKKFRVTTDWLLSGRSQVEKFTDSVSVKTAPVRGVVAAGAWLEADMFDDIEHEEVPFRPGQFPGLEQFAYRISGNSVDLVRLHDGDYAICVSYWEARHALADNDTVIVERRRGGEIERTCKVLKVTAEGYELWPRSSNPKWQTPIKVTRDHQPEDGVEIEIIALVIGRYSSF